MKISLNYGILEIETISGKKRNQIKYEKKLTI